MMNKLKCSVPALMASLLCWTLLLITGVVHEISGQVYTEKQTRHRFAQMNIGADVQMSSGGSTRYWGGFGFPDALELPSLVRPRLLIGGTQRTEWILSGRWIVFFLLAGSIYL